MGPVGRMDQDEGPDERVGQDQVELDQDRVDQEAVAQDPAGDQVAPRFFDVARASRP